MAIAALNKVAIIGPLEEKNAVLQALQQWGGLHLSRWSDVGGEREHGDAELTLSKMQKLSEQLKKAVHYLQGAPQRRFQMRTVSVHIDSQELSRLVEQVLHNETQRRATQDRIDGLCEREAALKPWGDFAFPEGDHIGGQRLWFYLLPRKHHRLLPQLKIPWQIIHQSDNQIWLVVIAEQEPPIDLLPCDRVHTGRYSLSELRRQRERAEIHLEDIEAERQKLTRYLAVLLHCQAQAEDITDLARAEQMTADLEQLFVTYGWVPQCQILSLRQFCASHHLALSCQAVAPSDAPPTLLNNPELFKGGELLVNFYQTPDYRSWDPAIPLFVSFALFFAMILSDAGYAALMLVGVLAAWSRLSRSVSGRLLRPLLLTITSLSIIWGVIVGSYFGREPAAGTLLAQGKLLDLNNFDFMMALSIACGIVHLLVANAQQIWLYRKTHRAGLHLGWFMLLIFAPVLGLNWGAGNKLYWLGLGGSGLAGSLIFLFASDRAVVSPATLVFRLLDGLKALTDVTNLFGDVLSYLRLFALGLASTSLALTFNNLADQAFAAEGGFGIITGILIFIVGHTLNILLAVVSGVVHGLRLNFIEFYKWALYGEGYPFRAFKKRESAE